MKALLIILLFFACSCSGTRRINEQPFAPKAKYGKYPTKKCVNKEKQYWIFRQWGR